MSKPMGYTITLLRAGGTSWDEENRLIGQTDLAMTEQGSDSVAKAIHEGSFEHPFGVILVSDEEAASATASMLPRGSETKVRTIPELSNIGLGLWEGVLSKDLEERNPSTYAQWRDHTAHYTPPKSEEWRRWFGQNATPMKQAEFAVFLEDNMRDIATADGLPTAAQMLKMALQFEAKQDMRLKSHIRLQSGGVEMNFVQDDDTGTIEKMRIFERFRLGIPVFWNGAAYAIDARLRYRVRDGAVSFWFELIRPDRVLEDATRTLIDNLLLATEVPLFHGKPQ